MNQQNYTRTPEDEAYLAELEERERQEQAHLQELEEIERTERELEEREAEARSSTPNAETANAPQEASPGFWGTIKDIGRGAYRGSLKAAEEASELADMTADWLDENVADLTLHNLLGIGSDDDPGVFDVTEGAANQTLHEAEETETVAGAVAEPISQFLAGFLLTRSVGKAKAVQRMGLTGRAVVAEGRAVAAGVAAFDGHEKRLSDLVEAYPPLQNPVTEYLKADPNDSEAEGRLKAGLEAVLLGPLGVGADRAIDGMVNGIRAIKAARRAKKLKQAEEAIEAQGDIPLRQADEVEAEEIVIESAEEVASGSASTQARGLIRSTEEPRASAVDTFTGGVRRGVERLKGSPEAITKLTQRIAKGELSGASDLIDFNASKVDFNQLADEALDDPDAIRRIINTVSEEIGDIVADGVQSWDDTEAAAAAIFKVAGKRAGGSMDHTSALFADVTGGGGLASRYLAAEKLNYALAQAVLKASKAVGGNPQAELGLHKLINLMSMTQAQVRGSKREVARTLNAMKKGRELEGMSDVVLSQTLDNIASPEVRRALVDKLSKAKSVEDIEKIVTRTRYESIRDTALAIYIQGLLSSPSTLAINVVGNAYKVMEESLVRYMAAGYNDTLRLMGRDMGDAETFASANAYLFGVIEGSVTALRAPVADMVKALPKKGWKGVAEAAEQASKDGRMGTSYTAFRTMQGSVGSHEITRAAGAANRDIDNLAVNLFTGWQYPMRAIIATDDFFKVASKRAAIGSAAMRRAQREGVEKGMDAKWIMERAKKLKDDPTEDILEEALEHANYQTFQTKVSSDTMKGVESILNRVPMLRFIAVPFFTTPSNLIKQGLERTPIVGQGIAVARGMRKEATAGDMTLQLSRSVIGTTVGLYFLNEAMEGRMTGSRRPDLSRRYSGDLDGRAPYSWQFPGTDTWVQVSRLDPLGFVASMMADMVELKKNWQDTPEEEEAFKMAGDVMASVLRQLSEKSWFQGVTQVFGAFQGASGDRMGRYLGRKASDLFAPLQSLSRRLSGVDEEFLRDAADFWDYYKQRYGLLGDETLAIRRDYLGRPIPKTKGLGPDVASPIIVTNEREDAVSKALAEINFGYRMPSRKLGGVAEMNPHQYNRYLELRGTVKHGEMSLIDALHGLVTSEEWKSMTRHAKEKLVKDTVSEFGEIARLRLLAESQRHTELLEQYGDRPKDQWPEELRQLDEVHGGNPHLSIVYRYQKLLPAYKDVPASEQPREFRELERMYMEHRMSATGWLAGRENPFLPPKPVNVSSNVERVRDDRERSIALRIVVDPEDWHGVINGYAIDGVDPQDFASDLDPSDVQDIRDALELSP